MEKKLAEAALGYIRGGMTIGLGAGKAVEYLIEFISMGEYPNLKIATNQMHTAFMCRERNLNLVPTWTVSHLDYTFDTLDFIDKDANGALGGSTFLLEDKLLASMADKFVCLVDEADTGTILSPEFPVELEVSKSALFFVDAKLKELDAEVYLHSEDSIEPFISSDGNYVIEAEFKDGKNLKELDHTLSAIPGVITTSIYTGIPTIALIAGAEGIQTIEN